MQTHDAHDAGEFQRQRQINDKQHKQRRNTEDPTQLTNAGSEPLSTRKKLVTSPARKTTNSQSIRLHARFISAGRVTTSSCLNRLAPRHLTCKSQWDRSARGSPPHASLTGGHQARILPASHLTCEEARGGAQVNASGPRRCGCRSGSFIKTSSNQETRAAALNVERL